MPRTSGRHVRRGTVLIVEGDAPMREVFAGVLEDDGLGVVTAGTRAQAEELLFESRHPFGCLVLDVGLGDEGEGQKLLETVAAMKSPPPTVLLSALRSRVEPLATKYGVPFLLKPFDLAVFHAAVMAALDNGLRPYPRVA